jgi:lysophospholipase L1-like esterase
MSYSIRRLQRLSLRACSILLFSGFPAVAQNQSLDQTFALRDGDTVVFYGDSITAQHLYTRYAEEFVLTRYPKLHVRFLNAGVPGDTTYGGYAGTTAERIQKDVVPFKPTMITVMLGMNDGGYVPKSAEIDAVFQKGYHILIDSLGKVAPKAAMTLICPSPYDEITHGTEFPGYSRVIERNSEDIRQIADSLMKSGDKKVLLADFHRPLTNALQSAKAQFPQLAPLLIPDRIHPMEASHWIMTATLLSAWHVDPVVSRLVIDSKNVGIKEKQRTAVNNLAKTTTGLQWTQTDEALPLPIDLNNAMTPVLLAVSHFADEDQLTLQIDSLDPGNYTLLIDGKSITDFSQSELSHGVNLALYKTPMLDQARDIDWNEERRAYLDQARFILSAEVKQPSSYAGSQVQIRQASDELDAAIRAKLDPKPHHFELRHE